MPILLQRSWVGFQDSSEWEFMSETDIYRDQQISKKEEAEGIHVSGPLACPSTGRCAAPSGCWQRVQNEILHFIKHAAPSQLATKLEGSFNLSLFCD